MAKLTVTKSDALADWWVIEQVGERRVWIEETDYGGRVMDSLRISDADVEGSGIEVRAIAEAIQRHEGAEFKRCAVSWEPDGVRFWSPRNSQEPSELFTHAEADALAELILKTIPSAA